MRVRRSHRRAAGGGHGLGVPAGVAREDPAPQHLRVGLVPEDGPPPHEEDAARPRALRGRHQHPAGGVPALHPVSTISIISSCIYGTGQ